MAKNDDLVPALLSNLKLYCEAHPDLSSNKTEAEVIRHVRLSAASKYLEILRQIGPEDHLITFDGQVLAPTVGIRTNIVWHGHHTDPNRNLLVYETQGWSEGNIL
jgi:hypothetical protein